MNNTLLDKENAADEKVLSFEYDVKNKEEEEAFITFQKKYVYKSNIIKTVIFGILAVLFLISFIRDPKEYLNPVLMVICLTVIFVVWFNTKKIRSSLMQALKVLENDKYIFTLYDDRFTIETEVDESEFEEDEEIPVIPPRVVYFKDISLSVIEKLDMFVLILKKDTIYVLPKRCFDENVSGELHDRFSSLLGEDYETEL